MLEKESAIPDQYPLSLNTLSNSNSGWEKSGSQRYAASNSSLPATFDK
nr:hypothetical protein [Endozoicomonas sp. YOMI1]